MNPAAQTSTLLTWLLNGLVVATAAAAVAVVVCAVAIVTARVRSNAPVVDTSLAAADNATVTATAIPMDSARGRGGQANRRNRSIDPTSHTAPSDAEEPKRPPLPVGAEAALNAIVELRPDPRNVVVTHRDPTGEVRLRPLPDTDDGNIRFERSA